MWLFSFQLPIFYRSHLFYLLGISNKVILTRLNWSWPEGAASSDTICVEIQECLGLKSRLRGSCGAEKC